MAIAGPYTGNPIEQPWWTLGEDEVFDAINKVVEFISNQQQYWHDSLLRTMRLYGGVEIAGFGPFAYSQSGVPFRPSDRVSYNVVASVVDTYDSRASKNRPRVRFLTSDGDYTQKRKAKNLQRFIDGQFQAVDAYGLGRKQVKDSAWAGSGISYWYREGDKICAERVFPGEVFIDPREAIEGFPRQLYRVKYVDRGVLMELFPDKQPILEETTAYEDPASSASNSFAYTRDLVQVIEAWHLPSGPEANDGKWVTVVGNGTLDYNPWHRNRFPFVKLDYTAALRGWWGSGIADDLTGIQFEINTLLRKIQQIYHLNALPIFMIPHGSKVNSQKLDNVPGLQIRYAGDKEPRLVTAQLLSAEFYQHLWKLVDVAFERHGVSLLSATAQKPPGLNSGRALQEYNDIGSERHMTQGRTIEQMYMDYSCQIMDLAQDIENDPAVGGAFVNGLTNQGIIKLRFKDVNLDEEQYVMKVSPTSSLPATPEGKLQWVTDMMSSGLIPDPSIAVQVLDFPDLEAYTGLRDAALEDIERVIEILEDGKYEAPEPYMDFKRAAPLVQAAMMRAKNQGAGEEVLAKFRRYLVDITAVQQRAQAQAQALQAQAMQEAQAGAQPLGGPSPAGAPGPGGPAPVSQLPQPGGERAPAPTAAAPGVG